MHKLHPPPGPDLWPCHEPYEGQSPGPCRGSADSGLMGEESRWSWRGLFLLLERLLTPTHVGLHWGNPGAMRVEGLPGSGVRWTGFESR